MFLPVWIFSFKWIVFILISNKIFIIAEMSANHNHKLENALAIIKAAKEAGADAVKFQT